MVYVYALQLQVTYSPTLLLSIMAFPSGMEGMLCLSDHGADLRDD